MQDIHLNKLKQQQNIELIVEQNNLINFEIY